MIGPPVRVTHIVGARPNFMKAAPVLGELAKTPGLFQQTLIHTGQHYDDNMSDAFFRDLDLPTPDVNLGIGPGSREEQIERIMQALQPVLRRVAPRLVVVVGDVNSTVAGALVADKLGIPVAHVEAGLRSFDPTMPEEHNRITTDHVSELLFTTEESANENLRREGIPAERVHFVGNVMIDSLVRALPKAERSDALERLGLAPRQYAVVTLHRPSNVDREEVLNELMTGLLTVARRMPVVFPVHPRTRQRIDALRRTDLHGSFRLLAPLSYFDFLKLFSNARVVLTDSGGIQEETTFLGVPCLTLRANTERPVTLTLGTNRLVALERRAISDAIETVLETAARPPTPPPLWDGQAAERIAGILRSRFGQGHG